MADLVYWPGNSNRGKSAEVSNDSLAGSYGSCQWYLELQVKSQVPMEAEEEAEMMDIDDAASTRNASEMPAGGQGLQFRQQHPHFIPTQIRIFRPPGNMSLSIYCLPRFWLCTS